MRLIGYCPSAGRVGSTMIALVWMSIGDCCAVSLSAHSGKHNVPLFCAKVPHVQGLVLP